MSSRAGSPPGRRRVPRRARREVRQVRAERLVLERRVVVRQPRRVDLERRARAVVDGRPRRAVAVVARDRDDLDDAPQRLGLVGGVQPGPAPGRRLLSLRRRARLGGQLGSHLFLSGSVAFFSWCAFVLSHWCVSNRRAASSGLGRPARSPQISNTRKTDKRTKSAQRGELNQNSQGFKPEPSVNYDPTMFTFAQWGPGWSPETSLGARPLSPNRLSSFWKRKPLRLTRRASPRARSRAPGQPAPREFPHTLFSVPMPVTVSL